MLCTTLYALGYTDSDTHTVEHTVSADTSVKHVIELRCEHSEQAKTLLNSAHLRAHDINKLKFAEIPRSTAF